MFLPGPWMKVEDTDAITPEITQKTQKHTQHTTRVGLPPFIQQDKQNFLFSTHMATAFHNFFPRNPTLYKQSFCYQNH